MPVSKEGQAVTGKKRNLDEFLEQIKREQNERDERDRRNQLLGMCSLESSM